MKVSAITVAHAVAAMAAAHQRIESIPYSERKDGDCRLMAELSVYGAALERDGLTGLKVEVMP